MKSFLVKDLMVPLSEYATVPLGSTLFEAVLALEKAREEFAHKRYNHRAVLVLDSTGHVVGKLSQLDVLRGLQPDKEEMDKIGEISRFGLISFKIIASFMAYMQHAELQ